MRLRELAISDDMHLISALRALGNTTFSSLFSAPFSTVPPAASLQTLSLDAIFHLEKDALAVLLRILPQLPALRALLLPMSLEKIAAAQIHRLMAAVAKLPALERLHLLAKVHKGESSAVLNCGRACNLQRVSHLSVAGLELGNEALSFLTSCTSPRSVVLVACIPCPLAVLSAHRWNGIRSLALIHTQYPGDWQASALLGTAAAALPCLTSLYLHNAILDLPNSRAVRNGAFLKELSRCSRLRRLLITPVDVTHDTAAAVLPHLSALSRLHLGDLFAVAAPLDVLAALPPQLEQLSIGTCALHSMHSPELGDPSMPFVLPVVPPHLTAIDFRYALHPGALSGRVLAGLAPVGTLRSLRFCLASHCGRSHGSSARDPLQRMARAAAALRQLTQLRDLDLSGCAQHAEDAEQLVLALPSRLTSLNMSCWNRSPEGWEAVQRALCSVIDAGTLSCLQRHDLSGARLPAPNLDALAAALSALPALSELLLRRGVCYPSRCMFGDAEAAALERWLPACAALRRLDLSGRDLPVPALLALQHALPAVVVTSDPAGQ